jgi:hypothetical protein
MTNKQNQALKPGWEAREDRLPWPAEPTTPDPKGNRKARRAAKSKKKAAVKYKPHTRFSLADIS